MKICFVCLGNICRSPMAEAILCSIAPADWEIASRATGNWEHGNPVHPGTKKILAQHHIPLSPDKRSQRISTADFQYFDEIICMDEQNRRDLLKMAPVGTEEKIKKISEEDVPDPWYTGDFTETYNLLKAACQNLC